MSIGLKLKNMRKFKYIILSLGLVVFMLISCNKEVQDVHDSEKNVSWTQEDLEIQNRILDFQNKIKNNSFKNGEQLSLDDAIWNLEALINYNYSNPDSSFVNLTVDTTFEFNMPLNNGMVNYETVAEAAFAMEEHIVGYLNAMPNSVKFLIAADVSIKDNGFKDGTKTITIVSGYGSEYIDNPGCYTPFGADDYWKYGLGYINMGGYCDGSNQGQSTNSDAAEEIQYKINNPNCQSIWQNAFYTDIVTSADNYWEFGGDYIYYITSEYSNPNDDIPGDGYLYYLTLYVGNYYDCLSPEEMNFYLQGNLDIIESERQKIILDTGLNYKFMYTDLKGMYYYGPTIISASTTFGVIHYSSPIE